MMASAVNMLNAVINFLKISYDFPLEGLPSQQDGKEVRGPTDLV
jgi:hypothetical protein